MERLMESSSSSSFATGQVADASTPYVMLEVQHRMTPSLRQIVSHLYYNIACKMPPWCYRGDL
jgi:hypothetical protein